MAQKSNNDNYSIREVVAGIGTYGAAAVLLISAVVTIFEGISVLTIRAQRNEKAESKGRSEFSYGSFVRSVTLPPGSNDQDISVTYRDGILTVSVGLAQAAPAEKRIHVSSGS